MTDRFKQMLRYEAWANRRTAESMRQLPEPEECERLFAHILAAQKIWLTRLTGEDSSSIEVFPQKSLAACEPELSGIEAHIAKYLDQLAEEDVSKPIQYKHQSGTVFENTPLDILTHVSMHSHYHRGQIASRVRQAGFTPAATDFIFFLREGN